MIQQVSQTTLRNNIGSAIFQDILSKREEINHNIRNIISEESVNWGVQVTGVEIRQVIIPQELESAMSMQAQAEREKNATVTFGESEVLVAKRFEEASKVYADNPCSIRFETIEYVIRVNKGSGEHNSLNSIGND